MGPAALAVRAGPVATALPRIRFKFLLSMWRQNRGRERSHLRLRQRTRDLDNPHNRSTGKGSTPAAVAVRYEPESGSAPRVVAKGTGAVAEQILEIAFAHGVKVREDADLVDILSAVELDSEIPLEAFAAVAEILAYVYRANGAMPQRGASP